MGMCTGACRGVNTLFRSVSVDSRLRRRRVLWKAFNEVKMVGFLAFFYLNLEFRFVLSNFAFGMFVGFFFERGESGLVEEVGVFDSFGFSLGTFRSDKVSIVFFAVASGFGKGCIKGLLGPGFNDIIGDCLSNQGSGRSRDRSLVVSSPGN